MKSNLDFAIKEVENMTQTYRANTKQSLLPKGTGVTSMDIGAGAIKDMFGGGEARGAKEQYRHFKGWAYVAIKAIAQRVASQPLCLTDMGVGKVGSYGQSDDVSGLQDVLDDARRRRAANAPKWTKSYGDMASGEIIEQHPLLDALLRPNETMTQWTLMYVTVASLELTGCAYWWFDDSGDSLRIWPLPTHWVTPIHDEDKGLYYAYKVTPKGSNEDEFIVEGKNMAYFPLPDPSNPMGHVSPLQTQSLAVSTDEAIQEAQFRAFKNGIFPGVMMTVGRLPDMPGGGAGERPILEPEQRKVLVDAAKLFYQGAVNYNEPLVIDGMIEKIEKFSANPSEMDFMDSGNVVKARIFQAFGVNPFILGEVTAGSYAQSAMAEKHFVSTVVNPILDLMGQVITGWMVPFFSTGRKLLAHFEPAEADDADRRLDTWSKAVDAGVVTPNEVRSTLLNLPPCEDPVGDELLLAHGGGGRVGGTSQVSPEPLQGDEEMTPSVSSVLDEFMGTARSYSGDVKKKDEQKDVDLSVTEGMIAEAKKGLEWREEYGRGGTRIGVSRARQIIRDKKLTEETWRRVKAYFDRHQVDQEAEGWNSGEDGYPSAGRIAWALWGGDAGYARAKKVVGQLNREEE